jgi:hypothetical protein
VSEPPSGVAFFRQPSPEFGVRAPKAIDYFASTYGIPVIRTAAELAGYRTVFFSLHSSRDVFVVAALHAHKPPGQEWVAGGNAVSNPVPVLWAFDYIWIGDAFLAFPEILRGQRDGPSMIDCRRPRQVPFHTEPMLEQSHAHRELMLSKGCRRRCTFCALAWRQPFVEQAYPVVEAFLATETKEVHLASNALNDLSYYDTLQTTLAARGQSNIGMQYMADKLPQSVLTGRQRELLLGVEGVSARLRTIVNKPLSADELIAAVEIGLTQRLKVRMVHQFGLPGEGEADWAEFDRVMGTLRDRHRTGYMVLPFIPNNITAHTPMQWRAPAYNAASHDRIRRYRTQWLKANDSHPGAPVTVVWPMKEGNWFMHQACEWTAVTPPVARLLRRCGERDFTTAQALDYCADRGLDLAWAFAPKPPDAVFPWDPYVRFRASRAELWAHHQRMQKRLEA